MFLRFNLGKQRCEPKEAMTEKGVHELTQRDAGAILQTFYAAVNTRELVQACALLADDVCFATLEGNRTGKTAVCHYLQALANADVTYVINILNVSSAGGGVEAVQYAYQIFAQGALLDAGEDGLAHLCNGLIHFDGTITYSEQENLQ
jgi:hypothetical protein